MAAFKNVRTWSNAVKKRDQMCQNCGSKKNLIAHHVKSWKNYPELRYELSNGETLCSDCHKICHKSKSNKKPKAPSALLSVKEYRIWADMKSRCLNPNSRVYSYYGGRGIKVCDEWKNSFSNFINDIGYAPSKNHELERINVNGNYESGNCRWATRKEQTNNTRANKFITINGESKTYAQWEELLGLNQGVISQRKRYGWADEECVNPTRHTRKNRTLTHNNRTQTYAQWEKELGFSRSLITKRKSRGWNDEECLSIIRRSI